MPVGLKNRRFLRTSCYQPFYFSRYFTLHYILRQNRPGTLSRYYHLVLPLMAPKQRFAFSKTLFDALLLYPFILPLMAPKQRFAFSKTLFGALLLYPFILPLMAPKQRFAFSKTLFGALLLYPFILPLMAPKQRFAFSKTLFGALFVPISLLHQTHYLFLNIIVRFFPIFCLAIKGGNHRFCFQQKLLPPSFRDFYRASLGRSSIPCSQNHFVIFLRCR